MEARVTLSDRYLTYKQAAEYTGVPYFKIQRAAAKGLIPVYKLFNSRRYVKLSDINAQMSAI